MGKQRITVMVCDNPACGKQFPHSTEEPAYGYHLGKGFWADDGGGGPLTSIYACSPECIVPAVMHSIKESRR